MKRYIIWTTNNSGEFVKAESVKETVNKIQFVKLVSGEVVIIKEFDKVKVIDYHETVWEFDKPYTTSPEYMKR